MKFLDKAKIFIKAGDGGNGGGNVTAPNGGTDATQPTNPDGTPSVDDGNTDNGNTKYFTSPELPWTWVMFDVDFAFFAPAGNDVAINLNTEELGAYDDNCKTIAVRLLTNPEFKDYFLKRFAYQINEVWTEENILTRMEEIRAMIEPDMAKDCARWGQNIQKWYDNIDTMEYFVKNRNKYIVKYVQNYFGLTDAQMQAYGFPEV